MSPWRRRWALFLDGLLGSRCAVTGDRVTREDRRTHHDTQHPTDGACAPLPSPTEETR